MAAYQKFNDFSEQLAKGEHSTLTLKIVLTNSAPVNTNTVLANITQISTAGGYTTGGYAVPNVSLSESGGTTTVIGDEVTITASGAAMDTFRYVVLYNDFTTTPDDALIAWWDYGAGGVTLANGESFKWKPSNQASGGTIFTLA